MTKFGVIMLNKMRYVTQNGALMHISGPPMSDKVKEPKSSEEAEAQISCSYKQSNQDLHYLPVDSKISLRMKRALYVIGFVNL